MFMGQQCLVLGHAGFSQAFDEGVGVEGGLRLHGAVGAGVCKLVWRCPREPAPVCLPA